MFKAVQPTVCLTCHELIKNIFPQSTNSGNCKNCGNFITTQNNVIMSQAIKEFPSDMSFKPEVSGLKVINTQSRRALFENMALTNQ